MKKQGIFSAILPMLISLLALSAFAQDEAYIYNDGISSNTIDGGVNSQINTDSFREDKNPIEMSAFGFDGEE